MVSVAPEVSSSAVFSAGMPHAPIGENCVSIPGPEVGHVALKSGQSSLFSISPSQGIENVRA